MASLVLSSAVAAGVEFGGVTSFLLTAGALALDSYVIYPSLFPVPDQQGQRLSGLQIQDSSEGAASNKPYGSSVRVAGTPNWTSGLRQITNTTSGGGKGGAGGDFITYTYHTDVAVRIAKTSKPISRVVQVFADGKDFWKAVPEEAVVSNAITASVKTSTFQTVQGFFSLDLVSDMGAGGPDLSVFVSGEIINLSGFTTTPPTAFTSGGLTLNTAASAGATTVSLACTGVGNLYGNHRESSGSSLIEQGDQIVFAGGSTVYTVTNATNDRNSPEATYAFNGTPGTPDVQAVTIDPPLVVGVSGGAVVTVTSGAGIRNNSFGTALGTINLFVSSAGTDTLANTSFVNLSSVFYTPVSKDPGIDTLTLSQDFPTNSSTQVGDVRFLLGSPSQSVDPLIESVESIKDGIGAGQVEAFRNRVVMVADDLNMTDFGNRIPNFEFILEVNSSATTLETVLTEFLQDSGLGMRQFDVTGLNDPVYGFNVRGPQVAKSMLQPLFLAYQLVSYSKDGKLFFKKRDNLDTLAVASDDLGAGAFDDDRPNKLGVVDVRSNDEITAIEVTYRDLNDRHQVAVARSIRPEATPGGQTQTVSLDLVLDTSLAQQLADTLYAQANASARRVQFSLPPSYEQVIHEGMIVTLSNVHGQDWELILDRVERGANNVLLIEALEEDLEALNQTTVGEPVSNAAGSGTQDGSNSTPPLVGAAILDIPPLRDEDANSPGFYVAASRLDPRRPWRGTTLYRSTDSGTTYNEIHRVINQSVVGSVVTIPTTTVSQATPDRVNTIRVEIIDDAFSLSSVTEEESLLGHRLYLVGDEILSAATATLVSSDALRKRKTYDLSVLRRGLRDTQDAMTTHKVGERFIWLDGPGVEFVPMNQASTDQADKYKAVSPGGELGKALEMSVTLTGNSFRPFSPKQVEATRNAANDVTFTWEYHSRAITQTLNQAAPLGETSERYRIEIYKLTTIVRTIEVTGTRTFTYTAAEQTTDALIPGEPVKIQITQLSDRLFEGKPTLVTI